MKRTKGFRWNRKALISMVTVTIAATTLAACSAQSETPSEDQDESGIVTVEYTSEGRYKDNVSTLPQAKNHNLDNENAELNAPYRFIDKNGFTVQPVPSDDNGWNISYLNADNRGRTSCHTIEDALMTMDTYHGTIFMGYPTEQTYANCFVCHEWSTPLRTSIHSTHMGSELFENRSGTCESCHYVDDEGDFKRWDYEKYDLYKGITDVSADEANLEVSYDQDTITETDDIFFKSIKQYGDFDPAENWRTDDSYMDPALYENWMFTVGGEVENPLEMTLPELVEKFGTKTVTMKQQCCINGVGNATIFQAEVTGVSIKDIIDYVKPKDNANAAEMLTEDPYPNVDTHYNIPIDAVNVDDAILVIELNGETLPNTQGYDCAIWTPRTWAAEIYRVSTGINFIETTEENSKTGYYLGDFVDPSVETAASKPNSAVLNYPTGVVLEGVAGSSVTIEGFADAFDEPIERVEFSWDHGETWTTMETPDNDPTLWTYWRMNFTSPSKGAYLLNIRTTSIQLDGTERTCAWDTQFLLNVD